MLRRSRALSHAMSKALGWSGATARPHVLSTLARPGPAARQGTIPGSWRRRSAPGGRASAPSRFALSRPFASAPAVADQVESAASDPPPPPAPPALPPPSLSAPPAHGSFKLLRSERLPEYAADAYEYAHERSGARVLLLPSADEDKTFGVTFRTPVSDSRGTPHVLEHSVLCGSERYPVKEPFVELMKGSVHTFLNAFTYPDRTCYPVASTNAADFRNLVGVYLDAVFAPRAVRDPAVMSQEGWHYELGGEGSGEGAGPAPGASAGTEGEIGGGQHAKLSIQGVVFNEMKGVYSSPDSVAARIGFSALHPESSYRHDSGGDPLEIPEMTFDSFRAFHARNYRPDNALFWFSGDADALASLEQLDDYLSRFERRDAADVPAVDPQPLWDRPRTVRATYPAGADDDEGVEEGGLGSDGEGAPGGDGEARGEGSAPARRGTFVTVSWLLGDDRLAPKEELELAFLSHLLLGTRAAPLRRALDESGLGESVIGDGGDDSMRQAAFSVGLKGVREADAEAVERLVLETLEEVAREGFTTTAVEAALNSIEFSLRENNTGSFPRGLAAMLRAVPAWTYGGDPLRALRWESDLEAVKDEAARRPARLRELVRAYLLDNPHRLTLVVAPEAGGAEREGAEETRRLAGLEAALDDAGRDAIRAEAASLRAAQEAPDAPEDLATVPGLELSDLPRLASHVPTELVRLGARSAAASTPTSAAPAPAAAAAADEEPALLSHDLPTSDILYLDVALDARRVPGRLLPLLPTLARALTATGAGGLSFVELSERIGSRTGGVGASPLVSEVKGHPETPVARLLLRGKAVSARVPDLLSILGDVLESPDLSDRERVRQLVAESKAAVEAAVVGSGHAYALGRLEAQRSLAGAVSEALGGISSLENLRALSKRVEDDWEGVERDLRELLSHLVAPAALVVNATGDAGALRALDAGLPAFLERLEGVARSPPARAGSPLADGLYPGWATYREHNPLLSEALLVPTQVSYVAKSADLYRDGGYELHGSSHVASKHLGASWIWDSVRVRGGAYGGWASWDSTSGLFSYASYRDPRLVGTLDDFDRGADFLKTLEMTSRDLSRAVIGTIADIDAYQLPDARGRTALMRHLLGITPEERQKRRDEILGTSLADIRAFGGALDEVSRSGRVAAVTSAAALDDARKARPGLFDSVRKVL